MEVEAWNRPGASMGDRVRIRISGRSTMTAVLLLYLVPLVGFLLGVFFGEKLTGHQVWAVVIGTATLMLIYGAIRLLDRHIGRSDRLRPEIVEILTRGDATSEAEEGRGAGGRFAFKEQPPKNETG
jgi:positive regulator of sigma E activity